MNCYSEILSNFSKKLRKKKKKKAKGIKNEKMKKNEKNCLKKNSLAFHCGLLQ